MWTLPGTVVGRPSWLNPPMDDSGIDAQLDVEGSENLNGKATLEVYSYVNLVEWSRQYRPAWRGSRPARRAGGDRFPLSLGDPPVGSRYAAPAACRSGRRRCRR